ncbi:MAG: DNA helicase PcrA [Eubacteriales bacterium]
MYHLNELNPVQREAAEYKDGPILILAGAGSGKTRVLTYRIAHLIAQGIEPWNILALTFTNRAAKEMKERVGTLLGSEGQGLWVSTFHSSCVRILRREISALNGYSRSFVIYDSSDQMTLIKECLKELDIDDKKIAPRAVLSAISDAKNKLKTVENFDAQAGDYFQDIVSKAYKIYQKKLFNNNALDFDDIIMLTVRVFREFPDVLKHYQERFKYILVDEYQDTNHAQYILVKLLAGLYRNLCVVGDDDQSVYGWRGADVQNILDFERDYPETKLLKLEQNYRSTGKILKAANTVVCQNANRKDKVLWTENSEGEDIEIYKASNEHDEARFVSNKIRDLSDAEGRPYNDFAILYRTNAQSRVIEEQFMKVGIPYRIYSGQKFYERMEVKDILAYLKLVYNSAESVSFTRVVNIPKRGIGKGSLEKVFEYAEEQGLKVFDALAEVEHIPGLQTKAKRSLESFYNLVVEFKAKAEEGIAVTDLTDKILADTGYITMLRTEGTIEANARLENLNEFLSLTSEYDKNFEAYLEDTEIKEEQNMVILGGFLEQVSLVADIDNYDEVEDAVKLMTMHSAKGLEFPIVFAVGMEDGIFPSSRNTLDDLHLEEERRLCYVAITRAKEKLYLSHACQRMVYGHIQDSLASRFLEELPEGILLKIESKALSSNFASAGTSYQNKKWLDNGSEIVKLGSVKFTVGDKVEHMTFGRGIVMAVSGEGKQAEITVVFSGEIKKLIAEYAKMLKI